MKLNPWYGAALVPAALLLFNGAFGAQIALIGITLAIFFGTLSLRRPSAGGATTTHPGV